MKISFCITIMIALFITEPIYGQMTQSGGQRRSILQSGGGYRSSILKSGQRVDGVNEQYVKEPQPVVPAVTLNTDSSTQACPREIALIGLAMLDLTPDMLLGDPGCGDGRQLIEAVQLYGCRGLGVEWDPALANKARSAVEAVGLSNRIDIITADIRMVNLASVDAFFLFHWPKDLEWIEPLVRGKRVVSAMHPLPNRESTLEVGGVYYYAETGPQRATAAATAESVLPVAHVPLSNAYLVLFTARLCSQCDDIKANVLPLLLAHGVKTTVIDIDEQPKWGETAGPVFWIVDRKTKKTLKRLVGYHSAVYLQTEIESYGYEVEPQSYPLGQAPPPPEVTYQVGYQSEPMYQYHHQVFDGVHGSSHENRKSLIHHLLYSGIHTNHHTLAQLNAMTDRQLEDLHIQDHRNAGQVREVGQSSGQVTVQRVVYQQPVTQKVIYQQPVAQRGVAVWQNETYTAPVCNRPGCSMCNSIRFQLRNNR